MNKHNAAQLADALANLREAAKVLDDVRDELQAAFDDKSELWQDGERGLEAQNEIDELEDAFGSIEDAIAVLEGLAA